MPFHNIELCEPGKQGAYWSTLSSKETLATKPNKHKSISVGCIMTQSCITSIFVGHHIVLIYKICNFVRQWLQYYNLSHIKLIACLVPNLPSPRDFHIYIYIICVCVCVCVCVERNSCSTIHFTETVRLSGCNILQGYFMRDHITERWPHKNVTCREEYRLVRNKYRSAIDEAKTGYYSGKVQDPGMCWRSKETLRNH